MLAHEPARKGTSPPSISVTPTNNLLDISSCPERTLGSSLCKILIVSHEKAVFYLQKALGEVESRIWAYPFSINKRAWEYARTRALKSINTYKEKLSLP